MKEMLQLAQWWRGEWSDAHSEDDSRVSGSSVVATATNMNVSVAQRMPCARGSLKRWVVVQMRGPARRCESSKGIEWTKWLEANTNT